MKTFAFRSGKANAPYFVLLHTEEDPEQDDWAEYVRAIGVMVASEGRHVHAFVATDGGGPNASQRQELASVVQGSRGAVTHVFTTNSFVRGIVTAFRWVAGARALAHHPREFLEVCERCNVSPYEVLADFGAAQKSLPRIEVLDQLVGSVNPARVSEGG